MAYNSYLADTPIYEPSKSVRKRITRRLVNAQARRMVRFNLERPIISFTFDDCPKSAIDNGVTKLELEGWKSTIYIASGLFGITNHLGLHMNEADVLAAYKAGHEIGAHTYSHCDLSEMSTEDAAADMNKNRQTFRKAGLPPCPTFAYPYGQTTAATKKYLSQQFQGMRGITSGVMQGKVDLNQINSCPLFAGAPVKKLVKQVNSLPLNSWTTIFTHDIRDNPSKWGCTPSDMNAVIAAVKDSGAEVLTVAGAITKIKASAS